MIYDIEDIIKYLDGELKDQALESFESVMEESDELRNTVAEYKQLIKEIQHKGRSDLREKIQHLADNNLTETNTNYKTSKIKDMNKSKQKGSNLSRILAIAAGLALLFAAYTFLGDSKPTTAELFASNYDSGSKMTKTYMESIAKSNVSSRGVDPETGDEEETVVFNGKEIKKSEYLELERLRKDTLLEGLRLFDKAKWRESKEMLHKYTSSYKEPAEDYATATYFLAKTSLNSELYKVAIPVFEEYLSLPVRDKELKMNAEWETALCYLNVNEKKAKNLFDGMALNNTHYFQDEAKAILAYFE